MDDFAGVGRGTAVPRDTSASTSLSRSPASAATTRTRRRVDGQGHRLGATGALPGMAGLRMCGQMDSPATTALASTRAALAMFRSRRRRSTPAPLTRRFRLTWARRVSMAPLTEPQRRSMRPPIPTLFNPILAAWPSSRMPRASKTPRPYLMGLLCSRQTHPFSRTRPSRRMQFLGTTPQPSRTARLTRLLFPFPMRRPSCRTHLQAFRRSHLSKAPARQRPWRHGLQTSRRGPRGRLTGGQHRSESPAPTRCWT